MCQLKNTLQNMIHLLREQLVLYQTDLQSQISQHCLRGQKVSFQMKKVAEEENTERAPSCMSSVKSNVTEKSVTFKEKKEIVERVPSAMSAKSNAAEISGKASQASADNHDEENVKETEERSPSNMSAESNVSPRSATACYNPSEENTANDEGTVQRPPSTLSAKSARSAKSIQSNTSSKSKSGKSKASNVDEENHEDNMERAPSSTSIKSAKSGQSNSTALSKKSKTSQVSAKDNTITDTEEDTEKRAMSPVSAKSVKSNVTSVSTKSKASHKSENVNNEEDIGNEAEERTQSSMSLKSSKSDLSLRSRKSKIYEQPAETEEVHQRERTSSFLSLKSNISARTMRSNVSGITSSERTGHDQEADERTHSAMSIKSVKSNHSTKSNKLLAPEIPSIESSDVPNEGNAEEKSERALSAMSAKSTMSVRSKKSKVSHVTADENTKEKEERTLSPVSTKSDRSEMLNRSEVPAVTVEETEDRAPTAMSSQSKVSARSKKSTASEAKQKKSGKRSQSSLSVKSNLSLKSQKSKITDNLTDVPAEERTTFSPINAGEVVNPEDKTGLHEEVKQATAGVIDKSKSVESSESDLSQTLSSSDIVQETCETQAPGESHSVSKRITKGPLEATDICGGVADNKSNKSSQCKQKNPDTDDFELVPSSLPNASPSEVVNEWLKTIPAEGDMYDMEELSDGQKNGHTTEDINRMENSENNKDSTSENTKETNEGVVMNSVPNNECPTSTEAPNADNICTQRDNGSKIFHSSVQVMKVLLNPTLDRCNSLPEISPVYGRKLSTSARGLLDCLVKLQLIDHNPKNANEKDQRYQELMNILKSLWLCNLPENEHVLRKDDHHSVDDEFNHTSSSGVDVNSGSTGSGKSSDGVNVSQPHTSAEPLGKVQEVCEGEAEADSQWTSERDVERMCEEKQKEDDIATDETIRNNDSPRELPETPPSSNKSSGNDSNGQKVPEEAETECQEDTSSDSPPLIQRAQLAKKISQDPDPVWVLTLLTRIEKQFMTHYINAMREFKVRWNLDGNEQLDTMISELKTEVHKRIQSSIDRELRKIQGRAGLPRPPKEAVSRASTTQTEERRRRLKIMLKQSYDGQAEKSDDSATGTSYSDQRSENDDEYCPCETCIKKGMTSRLPLHAEVMNTAPVVMDFDLKRILVMKNSDLANTQTINCISHSENYTNTKTAETLVENVIASAVQEIERDDVQHDTEEDSAVVADEKEGDDVCHHLGQQDGSENNEAEQVDTIKKLTEQTLTEETVKILPADNNEEISKTEDERAENESADIGMGKDESTVENEEKSVEARAAPAENETSEEEGEKADTIGEIIEKEATEPTTSNIAEETAAVTSTEHQYDEEEPMETTEGNKTATDDELSNQPDEFETLVSKRNCDHK
ncbi:uncharacterized protein rp1l1b [Lates calcarifer]|uniref:Uncharacterized protein rp1l1b n=1 Tax=Lates calcarifer TaxID=8187 RepID=A0A4W6E3M0_LATCA|nr:uncharacterized protein rp1l1b [Lates calcarifer]